MREQCRSTLVMIDRSTSGSHAVDALLAAPSITSSTRLKVAVMRRRGLNWGCLGCLGCLNWNAVGSGTDGVLPGCGAQAKEGYQIKKFTPFNPVDKKTTARVITPSGEDLFVAKGAPQVLTAHAFAYASYSLPMKSRDSAKSSPFPSISSHPNFSIILRSTSRSSHAAA